MGSQDGSTTILPNRLFFHTLYDSLHTCIQTKGYLERKSMNKSMGSSRDPCRALRSIGPDMLFSIIWGTMVASKNVSYRFNSVPHLMPKKLKSKVRPPIRRRRLPRECTETQNTHNSLSLALSQRHRHHGMRDGEGNQTNSTRRLKKQQTRKRFYFPAFRSEGESIVFWKWQVEIRVKARCASYIYIYVCISNLVFGEDETNEHPAAHRFKTTRNTSKKGKKTKSEKERSVRAGLIETNDWAGRVTRGISLRDSERSEYGKNHARTQWETCARSRSAESAPTPDPQQGSLLSFCLFQYPHIIASKESTGGTFFFFSNRASDIINPACLIEKKSKEGALKHVSEASETRNVAEMRRRDQSRKWIIHLSLSLFWYNNHLKAWETIGISC